MDVIVKWKDYRTTPDPNRSPEICYQLFEDFETIDISTEGKLMVHGPTTPGPLGSMFDEDTWVSYEVIK